MMSRPRCSSAHLSHSYHSWFTPHILFAPLRLCVRSVFPPFGKQGIMSPKTCFRDISPRDKTPIEHAELEALR
jgi:hypothetical protein